MKTCIKKTIFAFVFLCASFWLPPGFAAPSSPAGAKEQALEAKAQPSIQVKESDYNFGQVMEGTPEIEHAFSIRNTGKEILKIERVRTG
jgi:hypothetical protein